VVRGQQGRVAAAGGTARERFLPECAVRGRRNAKLQYAVLAAAAVHGGTEPDLLDEVAWWQADDFWQYAMYAAVAYIRAAASRAGVSVRQACQDLITRAVPETEELPVELRETAAVGGVDSGVDQSGVGGQRGLLPGSR
jgi:hypothetical protein